MTDIIQPELKTVLRRLKLGRLLDTLPERFALARLQKMPHQDFLLLALGDEVSRRDSLSATVRAMSLMEMMWADLPTSSSRPVPPFTRVSVRSSSSLLTSS